MENGFEGAPPPGFEMDHVFHMSNIALPAWFQYLWFIEKGQASGNMYPVGKSLCAWYAGWLASATAILKDKREPMKLLSKAAEDAGCFAELFEIHEPTVSMHPWFSTASENFVYAMNQTLVQNRGDEILIAPAVSETWKNYAFKLACYGNLVVEVGVKDGQLVKLTLLPGKADAALRRTIVLPTALVASSKLNSAVVASMSEKDGKRFVAVRIRGCTDLIEVKC
ncbi:MAG: hypothetical protein ABFC77_11345 [Thermoguttaceae bacterium]